MNRARAADQSQAKVPSKPGGRCRVLIGLESSHQHCGSIPTFRFERWCIMATVSAALSRPCAAAALPSARPSTCRLGALAAAPKPWRHSACSSGRQARLQCHAVAEAVRPEVPSPGKLVAPGQSQQQVSISSNAAGGRRGDGRSRRRQPPLPAAACGRHPVTNLQQPPCCQPRPADLHSVQGE